ncbi:precorrin-2 C(20)-methyltransferase [uncultured Treponema sp.]|uniref:precorrin-2 C(20)-methyltransferase n=1 Tax=uncultured Treponema sp. TaxID=162155 RepID=UPI0025D649BD|nr:precorrin-2 C(20)-methyltransferase [uncultured Treponema sp.]
MLKKESNTVQNKKSGIFYAVSCGAGNAELLTLQAVRVLKESEVIYYPQSERNSIALDAIKSLENEIDLPTKKLIPCIFSMTDSKTKSDSEYEKIAAECADFLKSGKNVSMLSIGDVSLYSTAGRLSSIVKKAGFEVKFIAGVNSFSSASASFGLSLCEKNEPLTVLPADSFFKESKLKSALEGEGTKILMKMGRHLKEIISLLSEMDLIQYSLLVQKSSLPDEKTFFGNEILSMSPEDFENAYLSLIIIKKHSE